MFIFVSLKNTVSMFLILKFLMLENNNLNYVFWNKYEIFF